MPGSPAARGSRPSSQAESCSIGRWRCKTWSKVNLACTWSAALAATVWDGNCMKPRSLPMSDPATQANGPNAACGKPGMLVALEPMIATGTGETTQEHRAWPINIADGSRSVHHEHDVLITGNRHGNFDRGGSKACPTNCRCDLKSTRLLLDASVFMDASVFKDASASVESAPAWAGRIDLRPCSAPPWCPIQWARRRTIRIRRSLRDQAAAGTPPHPRRR